MSIMKYTLIHEWFVSWVPFPPLKVEIFYFDVKFNNIIVLTTCVLYSGNDLKFAET